MNEKPILFSAPMVRAILDYRKTQTRRVVKPQPSHFYDDYNGGYECATAGRCILCGDESGNQYTSPYGAPGDLLWVRETWCEDDGDECRYAYRADCDDPHAYKWRPSIYMPREASRITLRITDVRVERLQSMNFYDWKDDFAPTFIEQERARQSFVGAQNQVEMMKAFWDSINAKRGYPWDSNPWVWVITFERATP